MVFKLVRTDTLEPRKIGLTLGKHLFGRGKFLDCDDKRVSRSHGELTVTDDTVTIKALHHNPCFYIKKGTQETQILKRTCEIELNHGDKFGFLPDAFWYELLHCTSLDVDRKTPELNEEDLNVYEGTEQTQSLPSSNNDESNKTVFSDNNTMNRNDTSINGGNHDELNDEGNESQSLLRSISPSFTQDDGPGPVEAPRESPKASPSLLSPQDQSTEPFQPTDSAPEDAESSSNKRSHSPDTTDDEEKKPRLDAVKQEPEDVRAGPSNDQGDAPNTDGKNKADTTAPKPAPAPVGRERCMYGANCYRRNPQHKAQFAHPSDPDWGAGPRGVCPWGARCRKPDPRHWRDHDHPPGVTQPPPPPPPHRPAVNVKRVPKKRQSNSDEDGDVPPPDLIVTGKRPRKPLQLQTFSGSESENEDPYQTDESDEWQPNTQEAENTQSQGFTQDLLD